jgi:hypothetical protein
MSSAGNESSRENGHCSTVAEKSALVTGLADDLSSSDSTE